MRRSRRQFPSPETGTFTPPIPQLAISNYVGSGTTCLVCYYGQVPDRADDGGMTPAFCRELPTKIPLKKLSKQNGALFRNSDTSLRHITDGSSHSFLDWRAPLRRGDLG